MSVARRVEPEWLDSLPAEDPRAQRSRRDLRRINRIMRTERLIGRPLHNLASAAASSPLRVVELGAGDGELLLRIARRYAAHWPPVDLTLIDREPVVTGETLEGYRGLGWQVRVDRSDVLDWLAQPVAQVQPIIFANLFVHHFDGERLRALLDGCARHAGAFLCCEPRRSGFALASSRMLGAIGCNDVTRHDALLSVRAGFGDGELSAAWPRRRAWSLREHSAGWFSHLFCATRGISA